MAERIVCVEVVEFGTDRALVKHLFWGSLAWLPMNDVYGPRIWGGTKDLLVFDHELDRGGIPYIPPKRSPRTLEDFIEVLMNPDGYYSHLSSKNYRIGAATEGT